MFFRFIFMIRLFRFYCWNLFFETFFIRFNITFSRFILFNYRHNFFKERFSILRFTLLLTHSGNGILHNLIENVYFLSLLNLDILNRYWTSWQFKSNLYPIRNNGLNILENKINCFHIFISIGFCCERCKCIFLCFIEFLWVFDNFLSQSESLW